MLVLSEYSFNLRRAFRTPSHRNPHAIFSRADYTYAENRSLRRYLIMSHVHPTPLTPLPPNVYRFGTWLLRVFPSEWPTHICPVVVSLFLVASSCSFLSYCQILDPLIRLE